MRLAPRTHSRILCFLLLTSLTLATAQTGSSALPTTTTTRGLEALTSAVESLLANQFASLDVEVETLSAVTRHEHVDATFQVTVKRDPDYLAEVALTLAPFTNACKEGMRCQAVRFFGSGAAFGRAGYLDIDIPDEQSGRPNEPSLASKLAYGFTTGNNLVIVVELRNEEGQPVARAVETAARSGRLLPLGWFTMHNNPSDPAVRQTMLGPVVREVRIDVPLWLWERASSVDVTLAGSNVGGIEDSPIANGYARQGGMYLPETDAAELFVEPGMLLFNSSAFWDIDSDALTPASIISLDDAVIFTHVGNERVTSAQMMADALFSAPGSLDLTIWRQRNESSQRITCEAQWQVLPTFYPLVDQLPVLVSAPGGRGVIRLERGVSFDVFFDYYDCTNVG